MPKVVQRLTVDIPAELHRRAKVYSAEEGRELRWIVEAALRLYLAKADRGRGSIRQMGHEEADRVAAQHPRARKPNKGGSR